MGSPQTDAQPLQSGTRVVDLLILVLVAGAAVYSRFSLSPVQEALRTTLGLTDNQLALLQGPVLAFPMVLTAIPLGILVDRRSRVRLLFVLTLINFAGGIVTISASHFSTLLVARILVGIGVPGISTAALSLIGDLYRPTLRGRALTAVAIGQYGGLSLVFALGGWLIGRYGANAHAWQWSMFWLNALLIPVLVIIMGMREPARGERTGQAPSGRSEWRQLWQYRAVLLTLVTGMVMGDMAVFAVLTWASPAFERGFQLSPERIGALVGGAALVSGLVGPLVGGVVADTAQSFGGARRTIWALCALALIGAPAGLFAIVPDINVAAGMLMLFAGIGGAILVAGGALLTVVIPSDLRGVSISFSNTVQSILGIGLVPILISGLSTFLGGPAMLGRALAWVCVTATLLAAAIFAAGARHFNVRSR